MVVKALTPEQTNVLKGVGILLIVLHNFLHNVPPVIGENQFKFDDATLGRFLAVMAGPATEWVRAGFSFLGHYGVSVFVFLSAYGLTRKYVGRQLGYWDFLRRRFSKIYLTFLICVCLYLALWVLRSQALGVNEPLEWRSLLLKLTLVSNLVPGEAMSPVGPWWFMAFIFQFYLVYPWLLNVVDRWGPYGMMFVALACLLVEGLLNERLITLGLNVNHSPIGHMAVIGLGIVTGRMSAVALPPFAIAAVLMGFVVGNLHSWPWLLSDLAAAILLVLVPLQVATAVGVPQVALRVCAFYGSISMPLFLVNGFLRAPFRDLAELRPFWWFTVVCAIISLAFSTVVAVGLDAADQRVRMVARRMRRRPV